MNIYFIVTFSNPNTVLMSSRMSKAYHNAKVKVFTCPIFLHLFTIFFIDRTFIENNSIIRNKVWIMLVF